MSTINHNQHDGETKFSPEDAVYLHRSELPETPDSAGIQAIEEAAAQKWISQFTEEVKGAYQTAAKDIEMARSASLLVPLMRRQHFEMITLEEAA